MFQTFQNRPRIYNLLHLSRLVKPVSQTHALERACLCKYASTAMIAVEVGTYMGVTSSELAKSLPVNGRLYCVDPYYEGDAIRSIALRHLRRSGSTPRITMLFTTSEGALETLPSEVDMFFVDGDHSFEGLLKDWEVVQKMLKPGGIAAFHDTAIFSGATAISHGAVKCFEEVILKNPSYELVEKCMSLNVIRRKSA